MSAQEKRRQSRLTLIYAGIFAAVVVIVVLIGYIMDARSEQGLLHENALAAERIANLQQDNEVLRNSVKELNDRIAELDTQIAALNTDNAAAVAALNTQIDDLNAEIARLNAVIDALSVIDDPTEG
ncbi:MAG: hypothetical protein LBN02_09155 [Oscillospiraceae bacterium]|jgi:uncharacterized protein YlxW (UPF0749 family)|nr:hypothetical protein [Oscillospiraceae bacterium]